MTEPKIVPLAHCCPWWDICHRDNQGSCWLQLVKESKGVSLGAYFSIFPGHLDQAMVLHLWKHEYEYTRTIPFPGVTSAARMLQRLYRIFNHGLAYIVFSLGSNISLLCIRRKLKTFCYSCDEHCLKHMPTSSDSGLDLYVIYMLFTHKWIKYKMDATEDCPLSNNLGKKDLFSLSLLMGM